MQYTTIFFDLDDTLYSPDTGIWSAIRERMNQYMLLRMKLDPDLVPVLRRIGADIAGDERRREVGGQFGQAEYLAVVGAPALGGDLRQVAGIAIPLDPQL